jgi:hypothetical protein
VATTRPIIGGSYYFGIQKVEADLEVRLPRYIAAVEGTE